MARRLLLVLAFFLAALSLALFLTGGFVTSVLGHRVSARSPLASGALACLALGVWVLLARRDRSLGDDLASVDEWISARAPAIVLTVAGLAAALAVLYGSFSAAGSDASGYLSQAAMVQRLELSRREPLTTLADWPDSEWTLSPLGWRPHASGWQVPTYPVGLPLLMAPLRSVGGTIAACLIVPAAFFLAVWLTGALALRIAGSLAAILAAVSLGTSPVALIHAMQPMSDVPVTAAWLACWVLVLGVMPRTGGVHLRSRDTRRALAAGLAAAVAILIRPNLAPLAALPACYLLRSDTTTPLHARLRRVAAFAGPVATAGFLVAYLQWRWFGSPLRSGYGTAAEIYAVSNVAPNAALYTRWLLDTHGPWLLAAPVALLLPNARTVKWLLAFAMAVVAAYLVYAVFEVWTYLRFLLPALAMATVAVSGVVAAILTRLPRVARASVLAVVVLALAGVNVASARQHGVFRLADRQARTSLAGHYLAAALPPQSVIIAGEQSGALRYDTGRSILRWDVATPAALNAATTRLSNAGYEIWIALDDWEEEPFRRRFAALTLGALDWPPALEAGTEIRTRVWRLRSRERFLNGDALPTDRLR